LKRALLLLSGLTVFFAVAACPGPKPATCGPDNCPGCCGAADDLCRPGNQPTARGSGGALCTVDGPDAGTESDSGVADGGSGTDGGYDAGGPTDAGGSDGGCVAPGDYTDTLGDGGNTRTWSVHVPAGYDCSMAVPLILNFHGTTKDRVYQQTLSKMNAKSDSAGFIAVYPDGYGAGTTRGWNAGVLCCGAALTLPVDDVAFVKALLARLKTQYRVDPKRVFSTGHSAGGFFSYRLACEAADLIAAIAPVAAVQSVTTCAPSRPVPVIDFHGTLDTIVPIAGYPMSGWPSVDSTVQGWATRDGCGSTHAAVVFQNGDSTCTTYAGCPAGVAVTQCTVDGGGHTWPGGTPDALFGKTTTDLSATDMMWDFFAAHPMP
jgi:polyhydroxybutyrate depolymerase